MANKTVKTRVQIKRGTAAEWKTASEAATPFIPLDGEFIYYTDTGVLKIGDGSKTAKALPVYADGVTQEDLDGLLFAGSDTHGGAANSAKKLTNTTKIGSATEPVYFSASGVPVKCGTLPYAAASTPGGAASSAEKLDLSADVGTTTNPVYFHDGIPVETNIPWAKGATSGDRPALYTNKIIKGNVASGVDHHVGGAVKPIYIDTNGVPQECTGISSEISYDGVAAKATQLEYSTTFNLTGAVSASGVSFNGKPKTDSGGLNPSNNTANINVTGVKEAYLTWGGKNHYNSYGPIDAAMIGELGANRFAFLKPAGITIEYSRDSGATWVDYAASENIKKGLFGAGTNIYIGKHDSTNKATANGSNYLARVIIETSAAQVYTTLNKFAIHVSTDGSSSCWCTIEAATKAAPTTWVSFAQQVPIAGWAGWNVINTNGLTTYGNTDSQYQYLRFTFGANGGNTSYNGLRITKIRAFGGMGHTTASNMAKDGHLYSYDSDQNATFPGKITTTKGFDGLATKASGLYGTFPDPSDSTKTKTDLFTVGDVDEPVYFQNGIPVKGKRIPNILTGTTAPTAAVGQNGDIYLMPYANNLPAIYSGTSAPSSTLGVDGDIYILYE